MEDGLPSYLNQNDVLSLAGPSQSTIMRLSSLQSQDAQATAMTIEDKSEAPTLEKTKILSRNEHSRKKQRGSRNSPAKSNKVAQRTDKDININTSFSLERDADQHR